MSSGIWLSSRMNDGPDDVEVTGSCEAAVSLRLCVSVGASCVFLSLLQFLCETIFIAQ